jgi:hypothetical protein
MSRLALWLRRFFGRPIRHSQSDSLPFTPEEFARLITSGKPENMKILAQGLSSAAISEDLKTLAAADSATQQQFFMSAMGRKPRLKPPTSSTS